MNSTFALDFIPGGGFFFHDAQQRSLDLDGRVVEASGPIAAPHDATGRDDQQQQEDQGRAHGQNCVRDQKTTTVWHLTMGDKTPYQYKQKWLVPFGINEKRKRKTH